MESLASMRMSAFETIELPLAIINESATMSTVDSSPVVLMFAVCVMLVAEFIVIFPTALISPFVTIVPALEAK